MKKPVKDAFDKANSHLNDAYAVQNRYSKALDKARNYRSLDTSTNCLLTGLPEVQSSASIHTRR
jgi:hypothetical protein